MKAKISLYKKSIHEIGLSSDAEAIIWDFYVTRSFASSTSQKRSVNTFGIAQIPIKQMMTAARISTEDFVIIPCTTMPATLKNLDFETSGKNIDGKAMETEIDIDRPRLCCIQKFTVKDDQGVSPNGSPAECLFTHIRNAFAHGNTYFFDNGNVLLEDKDGSKITARILIAVQTLLDWIRLIDQKSLVYPTLRKNKEE